ncbi:metalloregulator ArsR/SmtB family transcription factor [Arthrobacter sp. STN4]|uniref:helix-turn-helix transcriptional regulator n=1 Tax=Arthrobacter sp. STN4 TaxID=2923276 RepID=UPI002119F440|nr:helix-turn-helix domain-containing protein [Arthrobacter sp. STN4]MCQ9162674.1 helix-turn-helix domain-containing protein [Arthrobacter sp. STN4]
MENNISGPPLRGPKPGGTEPVAPISKARAAVLERLRSSAVPLTVDALAAETGQHPNTAREHLDALVAAGFATRTTAHRSGRGRPASLYAPAVPEQRPAGYAALAAALARHIASTSDDPAAAGDLAGRQWAHVLSGRAGAGTAGSAGTAGTGAASTCRTVPGPARRRRTRLNVAASLRDAGFGIQGNADATDFTLTTCPIVAAARENPAVVCAVHLGLVKGLLEGSGVPEDGVELVPFAAPGICTLRLPLAAAT